MKSNETQTPARPETGEPRAGWFTVPIWLVVVFGILFFWAENFLGNNAGEFNSQVYRPHSSYDELKSLQPMLPGGEGAALGKVVYEKTAGCISCHGTMGQGSSSPIVPPLAGSEFVAAKKPDRLVHIVLNGLTGHIRIAGKDYDGLTMPPIGTLAGLTDDQVANVLTFVRGNKDWGNNAAPVKPEDVKAIRSKITSPTTPTVQDLERIPVD